MKKTTVLVIEDNELKMTLFREILQIGGFTVAEAADAETGIQYTREIIPTIILMDIQLPGMDGLSATRIIKKDPVLRNIPVVALTAYAMEKDKEEAKRGILDPEEIISFEIKQDKNIIREISIKNLRPERIRELKSSIRWTLEKMYDRMKQKN